MKKNAVNLQKKVDTYAAVSYINNELTHLYRTRPGSTAHVKRKNAVRAENILRRIEEGHTPAVDPNDLERMKRSYVEYNNYSNISISIPSLTSAKSKSYES